MAESQEHNQFEMVVAALLTVATTNYTTPQSTPEEEAAATNKVLAHFRGFNEVMDRDDWEKFYPVLRGGGSPTPIDPGVSGP